MLFLPEEMSAKLIITEKCGAACLFKMCTEFCFPGTRRLKHIQTIPWILDSFQSAVNSEAHRHLYLSLLSFSFSQTVPSVHLRLVLHCLHFSPSYFFSSAVFPPKSTNFHRTKSSKAPLPTKICDLQGDTILWLKKLLLLHLLYRMDVFWPRANAYKDLRLRTAGVRHKF